VDKVECVRCKKLKDKVFVYYVTYRHKGIKTQDEYCWDGNFCHQCLSVLDKMFQKWMEVKHA